MGNYRFRFSDMLPHSWVYKLTKSKHKPKSSSLTNHSSISDHRKSYHFTRNLTDSPATAVTTSNPPRKSCRRRPTHRPKKPHPNSLDRSTSPEPGADRDSCKNDIVIEINDGKPLVSGGPLRRIITKTQSEPSKLSSSSSSGVKLRTNSPRIVNRRRRSTLSRRNVSESMAVVKSSRDPGRDFRESMVEMIVEYDIRAAKDLEELLACYLSLNSDDCHDIIINVFKQIWFDFMVHLRIKFIQENFEN